MKNIIKYTNRYLARFIIEAETPLAIGSGERNVLTDRLVAADANGLPYIPGTALAGVLRNALSASFDKKTLYNLFGYSAQDLKEENKGKKEVEKDKGKGSRLILSSAQMVGKNGQVIDGIQTIDFSDPFYAHFQNLPIRQHVRITHKGTAEQCGKFDEQVVYKGTRFCFEMELVGTPTDREVWDKLLAEFSGTAFRIGGGTRKGFGAIKIVELKSKRLDLENDEQRARYLDKSSELNDTFWNDIECTKSTQALKSDNWSEYEITLEPDDFFLFGSGFGSEDGSADMTYVCEKVVEWENGVGKFTEEKVLIPATSVKGALAHRTAFHFNKNLKLFSDQLMGEGKLEAMLKESYKIPETIKNFNSGIFEHRAKMASEGNPAVRSLFGYSANNADGQRGNVLFSDIFLSEKDKTKQKLLNHVAIDRFTGGAMDGALFSEEVAAANELFTLKLFVKPGVNDEYLKAFECALDDLCNGMLPLGGGTMRGHGCFTGKWTKNNGEDSNEN